MARILIIEDQKALCELYLIGLAQTGHEIVFAHTGEDGIDQVLTNRPDLIILDLGLPRISGSEVAETYLLNKSR